MRLRFYILISRKIGLIFSPASDSKFTYFCTGIRALFLMTLFVDERAAAAKVLGLPSVSAEVLDEMLRLKGITVSEPILDNAGCEEVIAKLIPLFYPDKTAEDYYQAIEISNPQKSNGNVADSKGKKKDPNRFLTVEDPTFMIDAAKRKKKNNPREADVQTSLIDSAKKSPLKPTTVKRETKREEKDNPWGADVQTPLIDSAQKSPIKPKTVKREANREEEDNSRGADVQNSSTNKKLKIGFMGGLVTLGIGIGLLFVPGLQVIGIGFIVVGASVAIKTADEYIEENKKAKAQHHHREDKKTNEQHPRVLNDRKSQKEKGYCLENFVSGCESGRSSPVASNDEKQVFPIDYSSDSDTDATNSGGSSKSGLGTSACLFTEPKPNSKPNKINSLSLTRRQGE
jgi:hypothetical protein